MLISHLTLAALGALALGVLRAVPFAAWSVVRSGDVPWPLRLAPAAIVAALAWVLYSLGIDASEIAVRAPLALAYLLALAGLVFEARELGSSSHGRMVLVVVLPLAYVVLPALVAGGPMLLATIVIAWERMLAAYSFCVEGARLAPASRSEAVFFLTIDPSIVWPDRAQSGRTPTSPASIGERLLLGLAQLAAQTVLTAVMAIAPSLALTEPAEVHDAASYAQFMSAYLGVFGAMFLAHAGLANVQIAYLELAGMSVRERYDRPYFSTSPVDFWRRWNLWVGAWARRYVYLPVREALTSRWPCAAPQGVTIVAFLATFLALGLLHDLAFAAMATHHPDAIPFPGVVAFLGFGLVTVGWEALGPRANRASIYVRVFAVVGWLMMAHVIALAMWCGYPLLSEGRLPPSLRAIETTDGSR